ncbi:hypothetical protein C8R44DRAFT_732004 [Mycena epipterygia]|nr:hypothetical protein C8R44DRAFT_732004 [Mycena epipterygia]
MSTGTTLRVHAGHHVCHSSRVNPQINNPQVKDVLAPHLERRSSRASSFVHLSFTSDRVILKFGIQALKALSLASSSTPSADGYYIAAITALYQQDYRRLRLLFQDLVLEININSARSILDSRLAASVLPSSCKISVGTSGTRDVKLAAKKSINCSRAVQLQFDGGRTNGRAVCFTPLNIAGLSAGRHTKAGSSVDPFGKVLEASLQGAGTSWHRHVEATCLTVGGVEEVRSAGFKLKDVHGLDRLIRGRGSDLHIEALYGRETHQEEGGCAALEAVRTHGPTQGLEAYTLRTHGKLNTKEKKKNGTRAPKCHQQQQKAHATPNAVGDVRRLDSFWYYGVVKAKWD